jgi:hypothetical protein
LWISIAKYVRFEKEIRTSSLLTCPCAMAANYVVVDYTRAAIAIETVFVRSRFVGLKLKCIVISLQASYQRLMST